MMGKLEGKIDISEIQKRGWTRLYEKLTKNKSYQEAYYKIIMGCDDKDIEIAKVYQVMLKKLEEEKKKEEEKKMEETLFFLDKNFAEFELKKPIFNLRDSEPFILIKKQISYTPYSIANYINEALREHTSYYQTIEELIKDCYFQLNREEDLLCIKQKIDMFDDDIRLTYLKNSINAYIDRRISLIEEG